MTETTCCILGPRKLLKDTVPHVTAALEEEILAAVTDGCTRFIAGYAEAAGLLAAEVVADLKRHGMPLSLELALPYESQKKKTARVKKLMKECDEIRVICQEYAPNCFLLCGRYLVSEASRVIIVDDGHLKSDVLFAEQSAAVRNRQVQRIYINLPVG